jgi:TolA-binding protein
MRNKFFILWAGIIILGGIVGGIVHFTSVDTTPEQDLIQGKFHHQRGDLNQAEEIYLKIAEEYPATTYRLEALQNLALVYAEEPDEQATWDVIEIMVKEFSEDPNLPKSLYHIASRLHLHEKHEQQRTLYEFVADEFPNNSYAVFCQEDLVKSLCRHGDYPGAQRELETLTNRFGDHPQFLSSLYHVARVYKNCGLTTEAEELYHWVIGEDPNHPCATYSQGRLVELYLHIGNEAKAQTALDTLFENHRQHPWMPYELLPLARDYEKRRRQSEAETLYRYLIDNYPEHHYVISAQVRLVNLYLDSHREEQADAIIERLLTEYTHYSKLNWILLRISSHGENGIARREKILRYVTQNSFVDRGGLYAHWHQARLYIQLRQDAKAQEILHIIKTKYATEPEQTRWLFSLAIEYASKKRHDRAKELYTYLIESNPNNTYAVQSLKKLLFYDWTQESDETLWREKLQQFMTKYKDHPALPKALLASVSYFQQKEKHQLAIDILQNLRKQYPQSTHTPEMLFKLSRSYELAKDIDNAMKYKLLLLEQYPNTSQGRQMPISIANLYRNQNRFDLSAEWFHKAIALYPDSAIAKRALYGLANLYRERKEYNQAAAYYEQYFQSQPSGFDKSKTMYDWAVCLEKTGQTDKAIAVLQDTLKKYAHCTHYKPEIEKKLQQLLDGKS